MRITKLEHAALLVEDGGRTLVVDPGSLTTAIVEAAGVEAVVVTHEHADHWTPEQLTRLLERAPGIPVFGPPGVAAAAEGFDVTVVRPGDAVQAGPFALRFFGGVHEPIHPSLPLVDNVGVLVNETLYYPGDSYAVPEGVEVDVLAAPASGPWLRVGDAMDFILAVRPRRAFPTHDMLLSRIGKGIQYPRLQGATEQGGGEFVPLEPGETLDA